MAAGLAVISRPTAANFTMTLASRSRQKGDAESASITSAAAPSLETVRCAS
jgi:hypothetical protein